MQWFVEWVQEQEHSGHPFGYRLEDWSALQQLTTGEQPGIGARHMYHGDELATELGGMRLEVAEMGTLRQAPRGSGSPQSRAALHVQRLDDGM